MRELYAALKGQVVVGIEATGAMQCSSRPPSSLLFGWNRKVDLGRREADLVVSSVMPAERV